MEVDDYTYGNEQYREIVAAVVGRQTTERFEFEGLIGGGEDTLQTVVKAFQWLALKLLGVEAMDNKQYGKAKKKIAKAVALITRVTDSLKPVAGETSIEAAQVLMRDAWDVEPDTPGFSALITAAGSAVAAALTSQKKKRTRTRAANRALPRNYVAALFPRTTINGFKEGVVMLNYQQNNIERFKLMMRSGEGLLIGDTMGCGKTLSALGCAMATKPPDGETFTVLVLCPSSAFTAWWGDGVDENGEFKAGIKKFTMLTADDVKMISGSRSREYHATPNLYNPLIANMKTPGRTTYVIMGYDKLVKFETPIMRTFPTFNCVIMDEIDTSGIASGSTKYEKIKKFMSIQHEGRPVGSTNHGTVLMSGTPLPKDIRIMSKYCELLRMSTPHAPFKGDAAWVRLIESNALVAPSQIPFYTRLSPAQLRAAEVLDGDVVRKVLPPIVRYKVDVKITEAERARLLTILSDIRRDQTIAPAAVITKMNPVQRVTNAVAMTYTLNNIRAHLDAPQGA